MSTFALVLLAWVILGSAVTFALFGWDKSRARAGDRRVSERVLVLAAGLTGTIGGWAGMIVFRHKTAKRSFQAKMVLATIVDLLAVVMLLRLT